MNCRSQGEV